jgi:very-short-patch-repair endonuclease
MRKSTNEYFENLNLGAGNKIHSIAHNLRQNSTEAEQILWKQLRNRKIENMKFRRQHAIMHFVADFYCHEAKLIIEVDGGIHHVENCKRKR